MKGSSDRVLQVIGLLCVNRRFRNDFFANPVAVSTKVLGALSDDEIRDIERIGGGRELPQNVQRETFVKSMTLAYDNVSEALGGCDTCPSPPCPPCPDTRSYY